MKGSESEGALPNGVYVFVQIDDNFIKCVGGNSVYDSDLTPIYKITSAKFTIAGLTSTPPKIEQCILENFITVDVDTEEGYWAIKICEEDDNLTELYGGVSNETPYFSFAITIPYFIPENDTSSSTYSLRKTNTFDSLREKFEQMLDKSAE